VSLSVDSYSKPKAKGNFALFLMGLMVLNVATGIIKSMLVAASLVAGIMIIAKIISLNDAKKFMDFVKTGLLMNLLIGIVFTITVYLLFYM